MCATGEMGDDDEDASLVGFPEDASRLPVGNTVLDELNMNPKFPNAGRNPLLLVLVSQKCCKRFNF